MTLEPTAAECAKAQRQGGTPASSRPPLPPAVEEWSREAGGLLELLPSLGQRAKGLATVPGGGDPAARVEAFLALWRAGGYDAHIAFQDPGRATREAWARWGEDAAAALGSAGVALGQSLEGAIVEALKAAGGHPELVVAGDFAEPVAFVEPASTPRPPSAFAGVGSFSPASRPLVMGAWDALRESHPLRRRLARGDCYKLDGTFPSVVLGYATGTPADPKPRRFYFAADAATLTRSWAADQLRAEELRQQEREREAHARRLAAQEAAPLKPADVLAAVGLMNPEQRATLAAALTSLSPSEGR